MKLGVALTVKIAVILGTRPDIIKTTPIIEEIRKTQNKLCLIHSGQHYDYDMSDIFLRSLSLPSPDHFLNAKSKSQGGQTARVIINCEKVLAKENPHVVLVLGDTNTALGASMPQANFYCL